MSVTVAREGRRRRTAAVVLALALTLSSLLATFTRVAANADAAAGTVLARTGWTATASASDAGEPASNVLDGNSASRWSTGTAMAGGQSITVDMAATRSIGEISMDSAGSSGDYAAATRYSSAPTAPRGALR